MSAAPTGPVTAAGAGGEAVIELWLQDLRQLFESMDPTPFPGKDLDRAAADFLIGWAREHRHNAPFTLRIHIGQPGADAAQVSAAINSYFTARAEGSQLAFRRLMANGRQSLLIGLGFLAACLWLAEWLDALQPASGALRILREGLVIGGWVALWRPLEIFLYDWWPLRADLRLFRRLAQARVELLHRPAG